MTRQSPLEPLLGQIQIAKAATYARRCAKMSTLRNAWFENPVKKVFWEKSHIIKYPVYLKKKKNSISQEKVSNKKSWKWFKLPFFFVFF